MTTVEKMPSEHYQSLASLEDDYWWHQTRYQAVWRLIRREGRLPTGEMTLADVGCGTGGLLRYLRSKGLHQIVGYDYSDTALSFLERNRIRARKIDLEQPFTLSDGPHDVITCLDVLEHVANERAFLRSTYANLKHGGILALTVPAHSFLFSEWDRRLRHHRRYSRSGLRGSLQAAGFSVPRCSYMFSFVFPMALLRKWLGTHDGRDCCEFPHVPAVLNHGLKLAGKIELALMRVVPPPFGTTLVAVARKSDIGPRSA